MTGALYEKRDPLASHFLNLRFRLLLATLATAASVLWFGSVALAAGVSSTTSFDGVTSKEVPPETGSFDDLASPVWQRALHATKFENFTIRAEAADKTDAYLVYGPDSIYCAIVSEQSLPITATQRTNGVGFGLDDYVSLSFDTSGNGTNQYYFQTTPLGVRYQSATESTRYSPTWTAFGHVEGKRWLAEFAIPYRFLRGSANAWRVNFVRNVAASQQLYTWAYEAQMGSPFSETFWPTVTGAPALAKSVAKPTISVYGLAAGGADRHVFEGAAGQFDTSSSRIAGIDAKVPLTSSLNFDGTLNPDFSNLENDQQVISPQEFRYQYSEYRPFFTQGANYLPGSEVFYSPSIGIFSHGEKVEGQVGNVGVGLLNVGTFGASDRAFQFSYNAPNQETTVGIGGAQADRLTGDDSVLELIANNTVHSSQLFYGGAVAFDSNSTVAAPSTATRSTAFLGVNKANYSLEGAYYDIGPQYQPTDAFLAQNDIRGPQLTGSLTTTTNPTNPIRNLSVNGYADRYLDDSGAVRESDSGITGGITFHDLLNISVGQSLSTLRQYAIAYPTYSGGVTSPYDQTSVYASFRSGTPNTEYVAYSWGDYPTYYLQQIDGSISHQFSTRYTGELDFGNVLERNLTGAADGQTLERLTLFGSLSKDQTLSLAYRVIEGNGGFSTPGTNLAVSYFRRFGKGNTLQAEFGSPAASRTLNRFLLKYVILIGAGAGE